MQIKLLTCYKGVQFATNQFKAYMKHRKAFWADIFITFDFENELLTMTVTYNQLKHLENPTIETKIIIIGPWTPDVCHFRFTAGDHIGFGRKRG